MTKHTEGPWEVERVNKADLRITAPSRHIAKLVRYGSAVEQNMDFGNAALIAAAPDMLAALENLENDDGSMNKTAWEMVQCAIAKAKGDIK